jgi:bacteriorhodopsin
MSFDINKISVVKTTDLSISLQFISLIASSIGLLYKLPDKHLIINRLLLVETIVQGVEFTFYITLLRNMAIDVVDMAKTRYYDWFITTPTMHIVTITYLDYLNRIENNLESISFTDFIKKNMKNIRIILIANFFMLLSGYLYEIGKLKKNQSAILGYIFFIIVFGIIYNEYAKYTEFGKKLFYILFVIWGSYGLAFLLQENAKNNVINFLDLFAKNFFGIYLFFVARKNAI